MNPEALSPARIAASLPDLWFPRIIGEVDDAYVKVARLKGTFVWHRHDDADELFFVLRGRLRIDFESAPDDSGQIASVELGEGEMTIVPKGMRHCPVADEECHVLLFERKSTLHTGDVVTEITRSIEEQRGQPD